MNLAVGIRMQAFNTERSAGIVLDTLFVNCYWPRLDRPTRIFAPHSNGIKVMGTTPRNVWFPDDVEFLDYYPDALYPAEQAVFKAFPFGRRALINLSPAETQVWWDAYNKAVASFPPTHAVYSTPRDVNFLIDRKEVSRNIFTIPAGTKQPDGSVFLSDAVIAKPIYQEYVAELTPQESVDLVDGKLDEATLRAGKEFVHISTGEPM